LVATLVTWLLFVIASIALQNTLPPALTGYLEEQMAAPVSGGEVFALIALIILLVVNFVGLWKLRSWARVLYVASTLLIVPLDALAGPVVMNSWEGLFSHVALLLEGILLCSMFSGQTSQLFEQKHISNN
jgi:uncharacterized membrane protein (DUF2068 family)